jgi:hypothetical protein
MEVINFEETPEFKAMQERIKLMDTNPHATPQENSEAIDSYIHEEDTQWAFDVPPMNNTQTGYTLTIPEVLGYVIGMRGSGDEPLSMRVEHDDKSVYLRVELEDINDSPLVTKIFLESWKVNDPEMYQSVLDDAAKRGELGTRLEADGRMTLTLRGVDVGELGTKAFPTNLVKDIHAAVLKKGGD